MKKVLLINPHQSDQGGFSNAPLGLLYLAGYLKKNAPDINVSIIDGYLDGFDGIQKRIDEYRPDIVGITSYTPGRHKALEIAKYVKSREDNIKVVLGGPHATIMWRQLLEHYEAVDLCVLGEGEVTFLELVNGGDIKNVDGIAYRGDEGKPTLTTPRKYHENLDDIPFPDWDKCEFERYPKGGGIHDVRGNKISLNQVRIPIVTSRGCTGNCTFCLTAETKIATLNNGDVPIKSIKIGEVVKTHKGSGIVNKLFVRESNEIYNIRLESGKELNVTGEHPIFTLNRGWVKAKELNSNDEVDEI